MRTYKKQRKGCIYMEFHNRGKATTQNPDMPTGALHRMRGMKAVRCYKFRWVAEYSYYGHLYRCRSHYYDRVKAWLEDMKKKYQG